MHLLPQRVLLGDRDVMPADQPVVYEPAGKGARARVDQNGSVGDFFHEYALLHRRETRHERFKQAMCGYEQLASQLQVGRIKELSGLSSDRLWVCARPCARVCA